MELAKQVGHKARLAYVKHSAGLLAEKQNDFKRAAELWQESIKIFEELRSPKGETVVADLQRLKDRLGIVEEA